MKYCLAKDRRGWCRKMGGHVCKLNKDHTGTHVCGRCFVFFGKPEPVKITSKFATSEDTAKVLGVSKKRLCELKKLLRMKT